jgi:acyl-CoA synthetase (AMP-forming)/AMP-acid ligase II
MGWLIDGAEVKIVDPVIQEELADGVEGLILVRGYFVTAGIVKRERSEVFTPDGFYNTGDKGYLLGDQLFLTGRVAEVIKTSGNNVAPPEVEAVLRAMPEIKDAHVLGVPDAQRGDAVAALLVPTTGAVIDADVIRERCRDELSNYKVPRIVVVVSDDDVPWLATGKPDRLRIKAMLVDAATRSS